MAPRTTAPDQRGYAHSDKPLDLADHKIDELAADVLRLAEAFGKQSFRLVGHDWGGIIAWWVAARHPQSVDQLVVINAPHPDAWSRLVRRRWSQAMKSWYVALFQIPRLPEVLLAFGNFALLRRALCRSSRDGTFPTGDLETYVAAWSQPGALTAMLNYYRALRVRPLGPSRALNRPRCCCGVSRTTFSSAPSRKPASPSAPTRKASSFRTLHTGFTWRNQNS